MIVVSILIITRMRHVAHVIIMYLPTVRPTVLYISDVQLHAVLYCKYVTGPSDSTGCSASV